MDFIQLLHTKTKLHTIKIHNPDLYGYHKGLQIDMDFFKVPFNFITTLDIDFIDINDSIIKNLVATFPNLTFLQFNKNVKLTRFGLATLVKHLTQLKHLSFSSNLYGDDLCIQALTKLSELQSLKMSTWLLTSKGYNYLSTIHTLEKLELTDTRFCGDIYNLITSILTFPIHHKLNELIIEYESCKVNFLLEKLLYIQLRLKKLKLTSINVPFELDTTSMDLLSNFTQLTKCEFKNVHLDLNLLQPFIVICDQSGNLIHFNIKTGKETHFTIQCYKII